jgi:hypothetical protein
MGALSIPAEAAGVTAPCAGNDRPSADDPATSISYTTAPFTSGKRISGPLSASLYAAATSKETEWVAEVEDVAPNGSATPLTEGALLGTLRAVDSSRSWTTADGGYLIPYHPYTQESSQPVTPGKITRYDVEIFPTYATIAKGHSLRVTISTADSPHLSPTTPEVTNLIGGVYTLQRTATAASYLEVALT